MEKLVKIQFPTEYFSIKDTLNCGQVFRFREYKNGFLVYSGDKCAFCYQEETCSIIECKEEDRDYFYNYFDLSRDYKKINDLAISENIEILTASAKSGKGIRLLNQNLEETLFSFIISQNNNIPRIKLIIEKLCTTLGEKKSYNDIEYYSFPSVVALSKKDEQFYKDLGLGYRAEYIRRLAENIVNGLDIYSFKNLKTADLKKQLINIYGVGRKVADCVSLFGYRRGDSFPVDTWIEKVYRDDFCGRIKDREKISEWFITRFSENAGYFQQYLFFYKREMEKNREKTKKVIKAD